MTGIIAALAAIGIGIGADQAPDQTSSVDPLTADAYSQQYMQGWHPPLQPGLQTSLESDRAFIADASIFRPVSPVMGQDPHFMLNDFNMAVSQGDALWVRQLLSRGLMDKATSIDATSTIETGLITAYLNEDFEVILALEEAGMRLPEAAHQGPLAPYTGIDILANPPMGERPVTNRTPATTAPPRPL